MTLIICGVSDVDRLVEARRPSHVVTLLDPATMIATPAGVAAERHLQLGVNDIAEPAEGLIAPDETLIRDLLAFGRDWDERAPMLIHCWAGISRSTASAFVLACERSPDVDERAIALSMRRVAPHAYPNRRIVALADEMLNRGGRMVDAVEAMGASNFAIAAAFDFAARHR